MTSRNLLALALLLQTLNIGCSNEQYISHTPKTITLFDSADLVFKSRKIYSALTPWFNPFTQVDVKLELSSPTGRIILVPGFFDGDGAGGAHGRTFKVRVCPDEAGLWNWKISSNLPEFDTQKGSFNVTNTIQGIFSQGPVSILKTNPKRFAFSNQAHLFLLGKFLDIDQPISMRFTHTFLSEEWSDDQRENLLQHQLSLGVNKMNVYLANKGDYKGIATTPWLGTSSHNIKSRFDLHWWHQYEKWIKRLRNEGIIAHLWFFADDSGFKKLSASERDQLIKYGMARLSGYVNTIFTLALEWQESFTEDEIRDAGLLTQSNNPWNRLVSVHGLSVTDNLEESTIFFDEDWLDFIEIQTGFINHHKINAFGNLYRKQEDKPIILEEFSFGKNNDEQRINTWAALLAIPGGIGTGSGLKALSNFLAQVDITKFTPSPNLIRSNNAYAASSADGEIIIYAYQTGPILTNGKLTGTKKGRWYDPRKGEFEHSYIDLNLNKAISPPTEQDWVLHISR